MKTWLLSAAAVGLFALGSSTANAQPDTATVPQMQQGAEAQKQAAGGCPCCKQMAMMQSHDMKDHMRTNQAPQMNR
jgi:hypothetical protein